MARLREDGGNYRPAKKFPTPSKNSNKRWDDYYRKQKARGDTFEPRAPKRGADMPKFLQKKPVNMPKSEYGRRLRKWYDQSRKV